MRPEATRQLPAGLLGMHFGRTLQPKNGLDPPCRCFGGESAAQSFNVEAFGVSLDSILVAF